MDLFRWLVTSGQDIAAKRTYVPLPPAARHQALTGLASVVGAIQGRVYEAEASIAAGGARIAACVGCSGGHKVRWIGKGGALTYRVRAATPGTELMTVSYANAISDRAVLVRVNDRAQQTLIFPTTGGWDVVGSIAVPVQLRSGANTIVFVNPAAYGPDMDAITLSNMP